VTRFGNLTLLGRRLNEQIKNAGFEEKKQQAYQATKLAITEALLNYPKWSPEIVAQRQSEMCQIAEKVWPVGLI